MIRGAGPGMPGWTISVPWMKRILPLGLVPLALLLVACGGGGGGGSSGALAGQTPKQVLAGALAAAEKSGSVHFKLLGSESGKTETIEGDTSTTDGREVITAGTLSIQAEVVGRGAYVKGNAGGLEDQMGLSAASAATYAGKWISISPTDAPYASITKAVSLEGTLGDLKPTGDLTFTGVSTHASQSVLGVKGGLPPGAAKGTTGSAVLYVSTSKPTVPILFDVEQDTSGTKESDVGTFSNWGKPLQLVAPAVTVPFSSLPAS
jgi:hypothetical protein